MNSENHKTMQLNIFKKIKSQISEILRENFTENIDENTLEKISSEPPKIDSHGHVSTNAAMVFAKNLNMNPRQLAEILLEKIKKIPQIGKVEIAGPGFINLFMKDEFWQEQLRNMLNFHEEFAKSDIGVGKKINLEFVSANPTGPMHVGHCRGAVYGDSLASLLEKTGHEITREYYINDAGVQIDVLLNSVAARLAEIAGNKEPGALQEGLYPGDYVIEIAKKIHQETPTNIREFVLSEIMKIIKNDLKNLAVEFDVFSSEKNLHDSGMVEAVVQKLTDKNLIYRGILEPPKGGKNSEEDFEPKEQLIFKSTLFGDDLDRVIKKNDGSLTYFAGDLAYMQNKLDRGFFKQVLILGADHAGYKKRLQSAIKAISDGKAEIEVQFIQIVNFLKNGEIFKMSKRKGTYITAEDVIEIVGKDVLRFIMLTRKNDAMLDFDIEKVKEQSKDNPVFYVQYAFARGSSILKKAATEGINAEELQKNHWQDVDFSKLKHEKELSLIRNLSSYGRRIELAATALEPHRIVFFIMELAAEFHGFWNCGKEDENLRFITADFELSKARIALVCCFLNILQDAFKILKIEPKMEM